MKHDRLARIAQAVHCRACGDKAVMARVRQPAHRLPRPFLSAQQGRPEVCAEQDWLSSCSTSPSGMRPVMRSSL